MSDVEVTFSLTKADLVQAGRAIMRRKRDTRAFHMFMGLVALLIVGSGLTARGGPRYGMIFLQLGGVAAVILLVWLGPWFYVQQNLKNHTQAFVSQAWRLGPGGARVETATSSSSFQWSTVLRAVEDGEYFLLYVSDAMAYPIPKRELSTEQLSSLRSGLRLWLPERSEPQA